MIKHKIPLWMDKTFSTSHLYGETLQLIIGVYE